MPAEVEFHTGVADPLGFACRLLRKAVGRGARVVVHASPEDAAALDRALWTFDPLAFVPHARPGRAAPAATPVWIAERLADAPAEPVLVNLAPSLDGGWERFERLIEIVGTDEDAVRAARRRWREYSARGLAVRHHAAQGSA